MTGRTHLLMGLYCGGVYATATGQDPIPLVIAAAAGSLLPDVDSCTSTLGRKIFPAALAIQAIFHHRTLFHSPLLYGMLWLILHSAFPQYGPILSAAMIGIASHLILDLLNPKGIPLLYPYPKRFHLGNFKTGGLLDHMLQITMILAGIWLIIY